MAASDLSDGLSVVTECVCGVIVESSPRSLSSLLTPGLCPSCSVGGHRFHTKRNAADFLDTYAHSAPPIPEPEVEWHQMHRAHDRSDRDVIASHLQSLYYRDFLRTLYWQLVSERVKACAWSICSLCRSDRDLQAHHRSYDRLGYEILFYQDDLQCLCRRCHQIQHNLR